MESSKETTNGHRRRIRLFLLGDQALFRASLGQLLAQEPDFEVVGECAIGSAALALLNNSTTDIALVELEAESATASELMCSAAGGGYTGKFFIITAMLDARCSARALKLGVSGIFLKTDSADRLVDAIRRVANGEMWIDPQVIRALADHFPLEAEPIDADGLTEREQKVLLGIFGGLSNRKIGEDLKISESSVKAAVQQLFDKTGVRTRSQLVRIAFTRSVQTLAPAISSTRQNQPRAE